MARVAFAGAFAVSPHSPAIAYAVAFGLSAGQVFFSPAAQSVLPSVVRHDELAVAPVAVLLAVNVGFRPAFAVNTTRFSVSTHVLRGLCEPERTRPVSVSSSLAHAREALGTLAHIPLLKALAAGSSSPRCRPVRPARCVVFAQDGLGGGEGYCLFVAAIGAGAARGPLVLLRKIQDPRRPLFVFGPGGGLPDPQQLGRCSAGRRSARRPGIRPRPRWRARGPSSAHAAVVPAGWTLVIGSTA